MKIHYEPHYEPQGRGARRATMRGVLLWKPLTAFMSIASIFLGGGLAGCSSKPIVQIDSAHHDSMAVTFYETEAPQPGSYALYSGEEENPKARVLLDHGETVGFRKHDTGQLFAVAGTREIPIDAGIAYYWKQE